MVTTSRGAALFNERGLIGGFSQITRNDSCNGAAVTSYGAAAGSSVADLRKGFAWTLGRTGEGTTDTSDGCLTLGRVVSASTVFGSSGAGVSLGLAGPPGVHQTLLWKVEGPDDLDGGGAFRLSLDASGEGAAVAALTVPWTAPAGVRAALARKLEEDGWGVDDSHPQHLQIRHLPGGAPIAAALFTIRHEEGDTGKVPAGTYTWTLGVAR